MNWCLGCTAGVSRHSDQHCCACPGTEKMLGWLCTSKTWQWTTMVVMTAQFYSSESGCQESMMILLLLANGIVLVRAMCCCWCCCCRVNACRLPESRLSHRRETIVGPVESLGSLCVMPRCLRHYIHTIRARLQCRTQHMGSVKSEQRLAHEHVPAGTPWESAER